MWPEHNLEQGTPQLSLAIRRIVLSPGQAKSSYWGWIKAPRPHKAECWSSLSSFLLLKFAQENAGGFNTVPWSFTSDTVHLHPSYLVPAEIHNSKAVVFSLGLFFPLLRPLFFKYLQIRQSLGAVIIVSFLSQRHYLLFQFLSCFIFYYVEWFWKLYLPFKSHILLSRREFEKVGVKRKHELKQPQHSSLQH